VTTIAISGLDYTVYGSIVDVTVAAAPDPVAIGVDRYMNGSSQKAAAWTAGAPDANAKGRLLVDGTRLLDSISWAGTKTSPTQEHAWPRTGVTRLDGSAVSSTFYPIEVIYACYELAYAVLQDPSILDQGGSTASNVKRVKADTAEVEFVRGATGLPLPNPAWALISQFTAGRAASGIGVGVAYGTDGVSSFDDDTDFYLTDLP
jgi:hypothetical protein